jgi:hypothetical protein
MVYDVQFRDGLSELLNCRMSRRRLLQFTGSSVAGVTCAAIFAACGGPNTPQPIVGTPASSGTVTSNRGATRQITPYFLGYNNVPIHSPSWNDPNAVKAAAQLKPGTLRYPGGTVANYWDWRSGWFLPNAPAGFLHAPRTVYRLEELQTAVKATGAKPIYVLNMLTSDLNSQLEMLRTAKGMGLPVELVELGNEFYLSQPDDYVTKFPTGRDYGLTATSWINAIRTIFPEVKIAAVGGAPVSNSDSNSRKASWNQGLLQSLQGADALALHPYVPIQAGAAAADVTSLEDTISRRWQQFENEIQSLPPNMKVWFTEYNFVDPAKKVFRSWIDGVLAAKMSLTFLEEDRSELACFYDMIGMSGNEVIFYSRQTQGTRAAPLAPYALTAAGWALRLLGETIYGMTAVQRMPFSSSQASSEGASSLMPQAWIFTDGTAQRSFIINSAADSFTWTNTSMFSHGSSFQQLTGDPSRFITGPDSLTVKSGTLGSQLILPAYSVTQLS